MLLKFLAFYALAQGLNGFNTFLPTTTVPNSYSLCVAPNFQNKDASFAGLVKIFITTINITSEVVLHAKDLKITSIKFTEVITEREITLKEWTCDEDNEQVMIMLEDMLPPNQEYMIAIRFNGLLRNDMTGFYKSSYNQSKTSTEKFLAVTQFAATYARSAFPCYDEPHYKVTFNIIVGVSDKQIALSNMPILYKDDIDVCGLTNNWTVLSWFHFQQTPPISTYLVAFFVGEFVSLESSSKINVFTRPEYLQHTEYALDIAPKLLEAMELFTGIEYELPKLDLIALPDLGFGAMENLGINTFRERLLLFPEDSTILYKGAVTKTIQHELSHQWFGNLVTCDWWDYVWLNEGFATFFEYFATATVEPDWQLPEFFVVEQHQTALEYDQIARHPLSNKVSTPKEINSNFDRITYNKGASVLRMLYNYVGKDVFKDSLNLYLNRRMKGSANPNDLWDAFEEILSKREQTLVKDQTVNTVMSTWTEQSGYPVVNALKYKNGPFGYLYRMTQERFTFDEPLVKHSTKWFIGFTITIDLKPNFEKLTPLMWLDPTHDLHFLNLTVESDKWYIINLQSTGFFRVNYEEKNWLALIEQLKNAPDVIHVLNRAQLVDDSFNLARAGRLNYTVPLELTNYLDKENDVIPWYSVMNSFNYILDRMRRSPLYFEFENYVSDKAFIIFTKLKRQVKEEKNKNYAINAGWNIFSVWACKLNVPTCVLPAIRYFNAWLKGEKIPDDQKYVAFCVGLKFHPEWYLWNQVFQVYLKTQSVSERYSALNALACSQTDFLLRNYVEQILKGPNGPIRPQDYRAVFNSLSSTPLGIQTLLYFLRDNWDRICKELPDGESVAETIYSILASKVSLDDEIILMNEIRSKSCNSCTMQKSFDSVYKQVEINQKWFDSYSNDIHEFVRLGSSKDLPISPRTSAASPINSVGSLSTITCLTIIHTVVLIIYFN
ncbi:aminopeptidase N-like [Adelges cooleyi]|uniref:aminopeptidase N-like n=1 Tax=Adelges cooleyi TaxID=133065 RepID=UPI00217FF4DC|nr:aminopeptidase N-like [Adelges cooleyi]